MEKTWIMNATGDSLQNMLKGFLSNIDDFQQLAGDNDKNDTTIVLNESFNLVEKYYHVSLKVDLNHTERNLIRETMKSLYKTCVDLQN